MPLSKQVIRSPGHRCVLVYFVTYSPPEQVPIQYMDRYPVGMYWDQKVMNAMSSFWDESVGNITGALKETGEC